MEKVKDPELAEKMREIFKEVFSNKSMPHQQKIALAFSKIDAYKNKRKHKTKIKKNSD